MCWTKFQFVTKKKSGFVKHKFAIMIINNPVESLHYNRLSINHEVGILQQSKFLNEGMKLELQIFLCL